MKTREYALKGKEVPASLGGKKITFRVPETSEDVRALCKEDADVIELAGGAFDVWLQGRCRSMAAATKSKEDKTPKYSLEQIQEFARTAQYARRVEGEGGRGEVKPETKVKRSAANAGQAMFERAIADSAWGLRMVKLGAFTEEALAEYIAAKAEVKPAATASTEAPTA